MPLFSAFWGTTELCRVARPRSSFSLTPYNHLLVDRVGARKPVLANGLGEEMHIEKRSLPDQGWINHRGAPRPGLHKPIGRVSDDHGITRRDRKVQIVCAAEIVVVDGVEVAQRTIGKDGGDRCAGTGVRVAQPATNATAPTLHPRWCSRFLPACGMPHRFVRGYPVRASANAG